MKRCLEGWKRVNSNHIIRKTIPKFNTSDRKVPLSNLKMTPRHIQFISMASGRGARERKEIFRLDRRQVVKYLPIFDDICTTKPTINRVEIKCR